MTILNKIAQIIKRECTAISTRISIIIVLIGGIFGYGYLYNVMYQPNVVRDVPIAVVDMSRTPLSREYSRMLDATPQASVYTNNSNLNAAKELMKKMDVYGLVYIPNDFDQKVGKGEEAVFVLYSVTTAFLYYASLHEATAEAMLAVNDNIRPDQIVFIPKKDVSSIINTPTINTRGVALFNFTNGYATYLIPGVLAIIVFQTLIMIISMLSGKEMEEMRVWRSGTLEQKSSMNTPAYLFYSTLGSNDKGIPNYSTIISILIGKISLYTILYGLLSIFMLGLLPLIFQLPHLASPMLIIEIMIPYLIATSCFGLACSFFFTDSDMPLLMISFFSVGLVFLSGISYPLENMPIYWKMAHFIFPAAPGTLAFVKINSMGASMNEISQQYIVLWIQALFYFVLAFFSYQYNMKKTLLKR